MAVYKRYMGKRIEPSDPSWNKGTWVVEFSLRGQYLKEPLPEARTRKQAEQAETNLRQTILKEGSIPRRVRCCFLTLLIRCICRTRKRTIRVGRTTSKG